MSMDPDNLGSVEEQLRELRSRVQILEDTLRDRGSAPWVGEGTPSIHHVQSFAAPTAIPSPEHVVVPAAPLQASYAPIPPPSFAGSVVGKRDTRSLESRVGSQWFNRIGILAILIGMAWFLKFAIDNEWIGPLGRVVIGLIAGVAIIVWSERFRAKNFIGFSYSLKAVGTGILYLSLWASFSLYHLVPAPVAFIGMIAVTAFNGYLAWAQDAELLALYAIVGALGTPLLVSTGENHEVTLFAYLLLLDVTVLLLVILRPWSRLLFGAFLGTVIYFVGWWAEFYSQSQAGRTGFFLLCFFLIFAFAPRLVRTNVRESGKQSDGMPSRRLCCRCATRRWALWVSTEFWNRRPRTGLLRGLRWPLRRSISCCFGCELRAVCVKAPWR